MENNVAEIYNAINEYYESERVKDVKSIVVAIKSKRNLRGAHINYHQYIAEMIDKNIEYGDYLCEHLDKSISYTEYISEHISNMIDHH